MNKRMRKKHLTKDERMILDLYHDARYTQFSIHNVSQSEALNYTGKINDEPLFLHGGSTFWLETEQIKNGKSIKAIAFLKEGN